MDIPAVLDHLGYADQDWGPLASADTYEAFVSGWRGTVPPPTKQAMQSAWVEVQAAQEDARRLDRRRAAAQDSLLDLVEAITAMDSSVQEAAKQRVRDRMAYAESDESPLSNLPRRGPR